MITEALSRLSWPGCLTKGACRDQKEDRDVKMNLIEAHQSNHARKSHFIAADGLYYIAADGRRQRPFQEDGHVQKAVAVDFGHAKKTG